MTDHLFRENTGKMISVLTRMFGFNQIDNVMDIVQDTFESALRSWKFSGLPDNPEAWLMTVARNKALNLYKKDKKTALVADSFFDKRIDEDFVRDFDRLCLPHEVKDGQLRLLLSCCHPDLPERNQIIVTLYVLCGFGNSEIARALYMNPETVKKTLTRTKEELRTQGNLLLAPKLPAEGARVETVHTILYLMFNEGYKTTRGLEIINHDLCFEAIRLTKLLLQNGVAMVKQSKSLLALMFFNLSRFPSRMSDEGDLLTLEQQDRNKWNKMFIQEAYCYLNDAKDEKLNRYYLEAVIASIHCLSPTFEETDWKSIVFLYGELEKLVHSPSVALNKLIAESYLFGPAKCLDKIVELKNDDLLKDNFLLFAAEGDFLMRMKEMTSARDSFCKARMYAVSEADKKFLDSKIAQC